MSNEYWTQSLAAELQFLHSLAREMKYHVTIVQEADKTVIDTRGVECFKNFILFMLRERRRIVTHLERCLRMPAFDPEQQCEVDEPPIF